MAAETKNLTLDTDAWVNIATAADVVHVASVHGGSMQFACTPTSTAPTVTQGHPVADGQGVVDRHLGEGSYVWVRRRGTGTPLLAYTITVG